MNGATRSSQISRGKIEPHTLGINLEKQKGGMEGELTYLCSWELETERKVSHCVLTVNEKKEIMEVRRGMMLSGKRWIMMMIRKFCPMLCSEFSLCHHSRTFYVKNC